MVKLLLGKYLVWVVAGLGAMAYFLARHKINALIRNQPTGSSLLDSLTTRDKVIAVFLAVWLIILVLVMVLAS